MSKAEAIKMLKSEMSNHKDFDMIGFKREYLEKIISELEEDEVTDADIAVLGVSSVVFSLVKRIDDLEAWHRSIKQGKLTEISDYADGRTRLTIEI